MKSYLETNGTLPGELLKIIELIDIIAMDFKLPSSTGGKAYWHEHQEFLKLAMKSKVFWKRVNDLDALSAVTAFLCRTGCGVQAARYLQGPKAAKWLAIAGICAAIAGLSYGMPVGGLVEGLECGGVAASNTMLATAALYYGFKSLTKLRSLITRKAAQPNAAPAEVAPIPLT